MERTSVCIWSVHTDEWQKPPQYGKVISLQLKINSKNLFLYNHLNSIIKFKNQSSKI